MMAVPFAIPDDEINNLITTVFFILSQTFLERTDNDHHELQERYEEFLRLFMEEYEHRSTPSQYNQLRRTLYLLRESLRQRRSSPNSADVTDLSCCDDAKFPVDEPMELDGAKDCSQVGLVLRKFVDYEVNATRKDRTIPVISSVTSWRRKELPEDGHDVVDAPRNRSHSFCDVRRMFWCAVPLICMVGLHLFQTNYCI